jgi:muramidase (phage lysozyme)
LGRFMGVDPLADKYPSWSSYSYTLNNPIKFTDPTGMSVEGDIYNKKGVHIGNDGKADNKVYLKLTTDDTQMSQSDALAATNMASSTTGVSSTIDITANTGLTNDQLNMNAMLGTIREAEGHGTPVAYNKLYGGGTFDSYDQHPNMKVTKWGKTSTAAGAYQFLSSTWDAHSKSLGLADFSPLSQDKAAMREISMVKGATDLIHAGKYNDAISKLSGKWTSLPGGRHEWSGFSSNIFLKHRANELLGRSILGR